jgi:hypothetical protein
VRQRRNGEGIMAGRLTRVRGREFLQRLINYSPVFMTLRRRGKEMHSARHFSEDFYRVIRRGDYG